MKGVSSSSNNYSTDRYAINSGISNATRELQSKGKINDKQRSLLNQALQGISNSYTMKSDQKK